MGCLSEKIVLRDYQDQAVGAARHALSDRRRVLVVSPTASGKSIMIAAICHAAMKKDKIEGLHTKILVLCHQGHLLTQNEQQILKFGDYDTGVFCAGEGRKEGDAKIVLASRDSLGRYKDEKPLGHRDLILCDEAHMIEPTVLNEENNTRYSRILRQYYESFVIGFTGTPWRLGNGKIWGGDSYFQEIAFNIPMGLLIEQGHLCGYVTPTESVKTIDVSSIGKSRGDYIQSQLEAVSNTPQVVQDSVDKWARYEEEYDRKHSIFFCCGIAHAELVAETLQQYMSWEEILVITGEMTGEKRKKEFEKIKNGDYRAIVNVGVLTTGFDAPCIDCVVFLRATASASLFIQMAGRGLRTAPGKENCLMLDMAGNFERFNSIEQPFGVDEKPAKSKKKTGANNAEPMTKQCPECLNVMHVASKQCGFCMHIFINHTAKLSSGKPVVEEKLVFQHHLLPRKTKSGEDCIIVEYWCGLQTKDHYRQWLLHTRDGWLGKQAKASLRDLQAKKPIKIKIDRSKNEKFPNIKVLEWAKDKTNLCMHVEAYDFEWPDGKTGYLCKNCGEAR